ncbi:fructose-1,6-bisphosphatase, cytosolic-like isoform X3 [Rosa rugosa]|uniref:fructose-1,6-bisphosphatase, cytosolic-like isoform X3 n=1 Tax=Rosa rugosa TaxID=74645 RepID=UPI002B40861B|nr:fructose-1,6-bisphosphatase, cytosolic-like isoform X3 [Rosa rugosa]
MDHQADAYRSCCISSLSTLSHEETSLILLSHIVLGCKFVCSAVNKAGLAKLFGLAGETNVQVNGSEPFSLPISLTNIQVGTKEPLSADNPLHCVHREDLDRESSPWFLNLFLSNLQKVQTIIKARSDRAKTMKKRWV